MSSIQQLLVHISNLLQSPYSYNQCNTYQTWMSCSSYVLEYIKMSLDRWSRRYVESLERCHLPHVEIMQSRKDHDQVSQPPRFCDSGTISMTRRNRGWCNGKETRQMRSCQERKLIDLETLTRFICQKRLCQNLDLHHLFGKDFLYIFIIFFLQRLCTKCVCTKMK